MDKNILEGYQKRLEEIQAVLDENKMVLDAGIGTTIPYETMYEQFRTTLEKAQAELADLQQPVDMSDVYLANGGESYSDAREELLVSEYAKRKTKDYITPNQELNYANLLNEIAEIRQERRGEKIESLMQRIEQTQELEAKVRKVEKAQNAKAELEADLKAEQARIQTKIDGMDTQKASIYEKIDGIKASIYAAQTAIGLRSLPVSAFKATVQAKQDCIAKKAKLEAKIESLNQKIDELKGDYYDIDELLAQIDGRQEKEIVEQQENEQKTENGDSGITKEDDELPLETHIEPERSRLENELEEYCKEIIGDEPEILARVMNNNNHPLKNAYAIAYIKGINAKAIERLNHYSANVENGKFTASEFINTYDLETVNDMASFIQILEECGIDITRMHFDDLLHEIQQRDRENSQVNQVQPQAPAQPPKVQQSTNTRQPQPSPAQPTRTQTPQPSPVQPTRTQTPQPSPAQPTNTHQPQQQNQTQPAQSQGPQQPPVQPPRPTPQRLAQNGPYKIERAGLYISDSGLPTYYVELTDKDGNIVPANYEPNNGFYRVVVPGMEQEPELQSLQNQLIANPKKYYDFGLVGLLQEVDQNFGTSGIKDYQKMLKDKELQAGSKYKAFDIEYDLTKLGEVPIDKEDRAKVNYLKKLANANAKAGLATYAKAPSILNKISNYVKGLVEKITTKRLKPGTLENQESKKPTAQEIVEMYKKSWQDKDFNVDKFIKECQMTPEEEDTFRKIHQNRVKNAQLKKGITKPTAEKIVREEKKAEEAQTTEILNYSEEEIGAICSPYRRMYGTTKDNGEKFNISDLKKKMEEDGISKEEQQIVIDDYNKELSDRALIQKGKQFEQKRGKWVNGIQFFGAKAQKDMLNGTRVSGPKATEKQGQKVISTEVMRKIQGEINAGNVDVEKIAKENNLNQEQKEWVKRKIQKHEEIKRNQQENSAILERYNGTIQRRKEGIEPADD